MKIFKALIIIFVLSCFLNIAWAEKLDDMSLYHLPAKWQTQDDKLVNLSDLAGEVVVAVMIYTSCKAACPILIGEMKSIEGAVKKRTEASVKYVLITIDPVNDTPARLKNLSAEYGLTGKQWIFLRGTEESTQDFANLLAVKYKQISPIDFSHSNIISVFDKGGKLIYQREGLNTDRSELIDEIVSAAGNKD